jgi:hypothetical protein
MADLTPQPISSFVEITNLNNFNNDSAITLLDANATTPATKNANLKFKNLYALIKTNLNLTDANINTGINPVNINTNQLSSISSITVNQYGRVVQIAGTSASSAPAAIGVATGLLSGTISVPGLINNITYGALSSFQTLYTGNILVTIYFNVTVPYSTGTLPQTLPPDIYVTNNTKVETQVPIAFNNSTIYGYNDNGGPRVVFTGTAVTLIPCSSNTTEWKIGTKYPQKYPPIYTFNYTSVFQNNSQ